MALTICYWIKKMKIIKNLAQLLFISLLITQLTGCFPLIVGGVAETALVLGDRRPVSVVTIDRGIQLEADSLITQKFQDNVHVNVNVFNQKVLLTGEATTQNLKEQVQNTISPIKNIKNIVNEIQIGVPSSTSSRLSDSSLFTLVKAKLITTSDVPTNSIKITVEAGSVYLMGITTELEAKAAATVASKSSSSIKQVVKLFDIISEEEKNKLINATTRQEQTKP
jgi:osmotically-inducible protein OsmY